MIKIKTLIDFLILSGLFLLYFFVEDGVSQILIWLCLIVFYYYFALAVSKPVVIVPGLPSFFKPDIFFMMFYYILLYLPYQLYVLGMADLSAGIYLRNIYLEYTNISLLASTIGLVGFSAGFQKRFNFNSNSTGSELYYYRYLPLIILFLLVLCFGLFWKTGATVLFEDAYATSDTGSARDNGIFFLVTHFVMISVAMSILFVREKKFPLSLIAALALSGVWGILLLILGDRNTFFLIATVGLAGVSIYLRRVTVKEMVMFIVVALFTYSVIELSRVSDTRSIASMVEAFKEGGKGEFIAESSFSITTATSRAAFEIVPDKHDYFMGKFKLIGFAGIIPFSRGLFVSAEDPYTASSDVLREELLGVRATWGVGSNIVSDIYLDFGIFGVLVLMYILGYAGSYMQAKAIVNKNSLKWGVLYIVLIALYAELPRYSFNFPVRNIVWIMLLFFIYDFFIRRKRKL